jgi:rhomboid protease GluP
MDKRRMCSNCRAFIDASDRECPYCGATVGARAVDRRSPADALGGLIPNARFTTTIILLINFGLYAAMTLNSRGGDMMGMDPRTLIQFGAKFNQFIAAGQWWRLITAGFLHGGLFHLLMNSWALFDLGAQAEEVFGTARMIVFYFMATLFGFLASAWWSASLSVGSSAGIFGLIGAMIAFGMMHRSAVGDMVRGMYMRWAVYGLAIGLLPIFAVDNAAHIGGLAAGFGTAWVAGTPREHRRALEGFWKAAAAVALLITAYCFYQMVRFYILTSR